PHLVLGVLLVAACPSGGFSNMLVLIARADLALSVLLTSVSSLLSFITVPVLFASFGLLVPELSGEVRLPVVETLLNLLVLVVVPVGVGMLWRAWKEEFVLRHTRLMQNIAQIMLYLVCLLLLIEQWDGLKAGMGIALPLSLALCVMALATGYGLSRLVRLSPTDAATVAIEGSIRNLAVAFLIASTVMDDIRIALLPSVYFIAVLIVGLTFARVWRTRVAPGLQTASRHNT
ncbi:MAG: bile acid:sodium symporter, partial [Proteobacteria bacterium]|nr:bile acid:sodium symporter [Pseudomonadota bacterium]